MDCISPFPLPPFAGMIIHEMVRRVWPARVFLNNSRAAVCEYHIIVSNRKTADQFVRSVGRPTVVAYRWRAPDKGAKSISKLSSSGRGKVFRTRKNPTRARDPTQYDIRVFIFIMYIIIWHYCWVVVFKIMRLPRRENIIIIIMNFTKTRLVELIKVV